MTVVRTTNICGIQCTIAGVICLAEDPAGIAQFVLDMLRAESHAK